MATEKQKQYLLDLLKKHGFVARHGFTRKAKKLPGGPTMRQRSAGSDGLSEWLDSLTVREASELIDYLKHIENEGGQP